MPVAYECHDDPHGGPDQAGHVNRTVPDSIRRTESNDSASTDAGIPFRRDRNATMTVPAEALLPWLPLTAISVLRGNLHGKLGIPIRKEGCGRTPGSGSLELLRHPRALCELRPEPDESHGRDERVGEQDPLLVHRDLLEALGPEVLEE